MGCNYYVLKILQIYYSENNYFEIELDRIRGYYNDDQYDEDEDDYEDKLQQYVKYTLTPKMKPILIYNNNSFNKLSSEKKYKTRVEKIINSMSHNWSDITKIIKIEKRHEV